MSALCYAFDIDGVIVDISERLRVALELSRDARSRRFWDIFFDSDLILKLDKPRIIGVKLVRDRAKRGCIIIVTGRPRRLREISVKEFIEFTGIKPRAIFMRDNKDYRPSHIVKVELIGYALRLNFEILELHDDDEKVLRNVRYAFPNIRLVYHFNNTYKVI